MERSDVQAKQAILNHLITLPQKILSLHGEKDATEFLLYDICNRNCFNFQKAAYLVDNPDFDCLKGVAGFCADQMFGQETIWEMPELFREYMAKAPFHQKVRSVLRPSGKRSGMSEQQTALMIGDYLGLSNPASCSWRMKHDNQGLLIYESQTSCPIPDDLLKNGACLLGFCPVY